MSADVRRFAHETAVEVYGAFLRECVIAHVAQDRVGNTADKPGTARVDGRPVRLATISGKGGSSDDPELSRRWSANDNISLIDHLLSVARGALMLWLSDAPRSWSAEADRANIGRLAHAVVCVAFLHDIDKDLGLRRGESIAPADVKERMRRYGIDEYLAKQGLRISPEAMLNYIEEVEGSQAARTPAAPDYERSIAAACGYIEVADKLEGIFVSREPGAGADGLIASLGDPNRWPAIQTMDLKQWSKVEIHDHLHVFLLDRFQRALSSACQDIAGRLPLIEIVHDGRLLCVVPERQAAEVKDRALDGFLAGLPFGLSVKINNKLACQFVGGSVSWKNCRHAMERTHDWRPVSKLLALPKFVARQYRETVDTWFEAAGMETSWSSLDESGARATAEPATGHPGGDRGELDMEPAHFLAFLSVSLNHVETNRKGSAPGADERERELLSLLADATREPPRFDGPGTAVENGRARRVLLALWTTADLWRLAEDDADGAQALLDRIAGRGGLIALWLEGSDDRPAIARQVEDVASGMLSALRDRFSTYLTGVLAEPFDGDGATKRCILCNEPVSASRRVSTAFHAHGIKVSAFSGRDSRNDHLASASGDTHLCLVCLAELQLRQKAQKEFRGGDGKLPPLVSSPATLGLFGGLAFEREQSDVSMGLYDLNRFDAKKGRVYEGLDCQTRRIRIARLETLPNRDAKLVTRLRMALSAVRRLGRPIHIFRGAPRRHPAIFYSDALPRWLETLLGGNALRIEDLPHTLLQLELFENIAETPGLGIEWAKQMADRSPGVRLGALCVAWALASDRRDGGKRESALRLIETRTRARALDYIVKNGDETMNLQDNDDPLIRLAWLASRIQKRHGSGASGNKQLLCLKTALDFYPAAERSTTTNRAALVLGLAGTLEGQLKGDAAADRYRDGMSLGEACIKFAEHFADETWPRVFGSRDPTSRERRRASAIYRFALLEIYRERGIAEPETTDKQPVSA